VRKELIGLLPRPLQHAARQLYYARQISQKHFRSPEPEWELIASIVRPDDWVIDVGANVGHYTLRLADLVGRDGRVLAIEPVPVTFALLAANVVAARANNVSLFNMAASDTSAVAGMNIPGGDQLSGNYYQARLSAANADVSVLCAPIDGLGVPHSVSLVKIDAEGHEASVLRGMKDLIERDHPALIVETPGTELLDWLGARGYSGHQAPESPNCVLIHESRRRTDTSHG
jgi:FkbM family methyltransferase